MSVGGRLSGSVEEGVLLDNQRVMLYSSANCSLWALNRISRNSVGFGMVGDANPPKAKLLQTTFELGVDLQLALIVFSVSQQEPNLCGGVVSP